MANSIKRATVVAVDGKVVTLNLSGDVITDEKDSRKGQLVPEKKVDVRAAKISMVVNNDRGSPKDVKPAEIKSGDLLSCAWSADKDVPEPQNVSIFRTETAKKTQTHHPRAAR